jgi:glycosyltransferase involved in cell wall biosynthesis
MAEIMKISIITINRNNKDGLRKTMQSVLDQDFDDFEYIVVDGASDDGSLDVIQEFEPQFAQKGKVPFQYESKPDRGIFHAMNKGIVKANGEYLLFLNSGDYLVAPTVLTSFAQKDIVEDFVSGNIKVCVDGREQIRKSPQNVNFLFFHNNSLPHQATFIKKEVFATYGMYNEENKVKSDWENSLRSLIIGDATYRHIEQTISYYDVSGVSSQDAFLELKKQEQKRVYLSIMPDYVYETLAFYQQKYYDFISLKRVCDEYMTIKNGKFGWAVKVILWMKNCNRKLRKAQSINGKM